MFELATALMGLFSASIFLAHAVDAYRARYKKPRIGVCEPLPYPKTATRR
jgi:hypothetical protein